ncbi:glutathione S-transferase 1-1 [Contarinia nasturtii]|uniref:glutathione S-transferase 1-1 n=1 Tax=Contarinia nasturtii TaxID=265458 RepID=UPI0012D39052|nr:glutathione S-transferase 1-1 [Contarinia nasturtii]XP_031636615.1 glutathione S-transferase 1-1 [Contarinia nasturtii]
MKLYAVSDGPPSLACRMVLKALNISFELVPVNFNIGEHLTDEYFKLNPQKEIPVLDDDGFLLSESVAIMQYLCDQYAPENSIYPKEPKKRALVNHRLNFNMGFYYNYISQYAMAPIFFDYPRSDMGKKKVELALNAFETYLKNTNTKYAAGDNMTIADCALAAGTLPLEAIGYKFDHCPLVTKWYNTFKSENASVWEIGQAGLDEIADFEQNPPDLSKLNHPLHPARKN